MHPTTLAARACLLDHPDPDLRARTLMSRHEARRLAFLDAGELVATGLVTAPEAARIRAAFALGGAAIAPPEGTPLSGSADAAHAVPELLFAPVEEVWLIAVDAHRRPLLRTRVAKGQANGCEVGAADVLGPVLRVHARGLYILHNHPSGDPTPSISDYLFSERMRDSARLFGVELHDHLVIAGGAWVSCLARGTRRAGRLRLPRSMRDADGDGDAALGTRERRHRDARQRSLHAGLERRAAAHLGADRDAAEPPRRHREGDVGAGE
ncbi:MAG: JAB domain-containing protein [Myxococcota bacterium]